VSAPVLPWSRGKLIRVGLLSFLLFLVAIVALFAVTALLAVGIAKGTAPEFTGSITLVLVTVAMLVGGPLLWLGWLVWVAVLLARRGGATIRKRLPVTFSALGVLGSVPLGYAVWPWIGPFAIAILVAMVGFGYWMGKGVRDQKPEGPPYNLSSLWKQIWN